MIAKVSFTHGDASYDLEFEEKDEKQSLHLAIVLGNPRKDCYLVTKNQRYYLQSNKDDEGNIYINNYCVGFDKDGEKTRAVSKLGTYKSGGYFWHNWEVDQYFKRPEQPASAPQSVSQPASTKITDEELSNLPF